jgi:hypothetical protein
MISSIWAGFISALQMLLMSAAIFVAWWVGWTLRERSRNLQRTYRNAVLGLLAVAVMLALLIGAGKRVEAFVYALVVFGAPLALGLELTDRIRQWIADSKSTP